MVSLGGRSFSQEILDRISAVVKAEPGISRRQLSLRVCEWMNWRNPAGRAQEMSCRKTLAALHRRGLIELPVLKQRYAFQQARAPVACPPVAQVCCTLAELGEVQLMPVSCNELSRVWRGLLDSYHYLKSGPLCGAQLRYLVRSARFGWLGGLSYSACARRVECRDEWVGWTPAAREHNHPLLVNNSRFLIAPTVQVKCLASWVLARAQARLADDWEALYRYRPVLLETYVERGRFAATCYRAANWQRVGHTHGRGRQGNGASIKEVYVLPMSRDWQARLCREPDGQVRRRAPRITRAPRDWIEAELGGANMGDARLTARLLEMTGMFYAKPTANIPQACGSAMAAKAAYRFLDNEKIHWQAILEPHYAATEARVREQPLVLVAQDTTSLNYSSHPHTQGLGPIGTQSEKVRGLMVHDTLAFSAQGIPLGLLHLQCWAREGIGSRDERHSKPIEDKESCKWLESYAAVSAVQQRVRNTQLVVMADREADIHEVFAAQANTPYGAQLLIRAERSRNRQVLGEPEHTHASLWGTLEQQELLGTREILIPPSEKRAARTATLEVRSAAVSLKPPQRSPHLAPVALWAVLAQELNPPLEIEGLEWMLLTTVAVKCKEDAFERLTWYARRWGIEVYHRILKSGCRVEARQLEQAHRLLNCLAIDLIVAWRIYHLTALGEQTPEVPCTIYFTDSEWRALCTFVNRTKTPPALPPSLNEAVRLLGQLGGHLGRNGDGHPGTEVLWRGMTRLADIGFAYDLYHSDSPSRN
jgi:Druantia protein DruA/Transposase DNA-binding/Transposase Tn5 dimerisation domain